MKRTVIELRLLLSVWLLGLAVDAAPKDDPEGLVIVGGVHQMLSWLPKAREAA